MVAVSAHLNQPGEARSRDVPAVAAGVIARLVRSLVAARQRRADRDIAEILGRQGGVMARREVRQGSAARTFPFRAMPSPTSR